MWSYSANIFPCVALQFSQSARVCVCASLISLKNLKCYFLYFYKCFKLNLQPCLVSNGFDNTIKQGCTNTSFFQTENRCLHLSTSWHEYWQGANKCHYIWLGRSVDQNPRCADSLVNHVICHTGHPATIL